MLALKTPTYVDTSRIEVIEKSRAFIEKLTANPAKSHADPGFLQREQRSAQNAMEKYLAATVSGVEWEQAAFDIGSLEWQVRQAVLGLRILALLIDDPHGESHPEPDEQRRFKMTVKAVLGSLTNELNAIVRLGRIPEGISE